MDFTSIKSVPEWFAEGGPCPELLGIGNAYGGFGELLGIGNAYGGFGELLRIGKSDGGFEKLLGVGNAYGLFGKLLGSVNTQAIQGCPSSKQTSKGVLSGGEIHCLRKLSEEGFPESRGTAQK